MTIDLASVFMDNYNSFVSLMFISVENQKLGE